MVATRNNSTDTCTDKSKDLSDDKNYRPITCLNISHKLLTGLVGKFLRNHTVENKIWDESQLGAAVGASGTVDQLILDRCVMKEIQGSAQETCCNFLRPQKNL